MLAVVDYLVAQELAAQVAAEAPGEADAPAPVAVTTDTE